MEAQLRKRFPGQADIRIALVVAKEDVVARLVRLDEIVLEQQRLALGARGGDLDSRNLRNHRCDSRLVPGLLEVTRHTLLQVARLAHVQRLAGGIEHPVDARAVRQRREQLAGVESQRGRGGAVLHQLSIPADSARCAATSSNTARNIAGVSRRVLVLYRLQ